MFFVKFVSFFFCIQYSWSSLKFCTKQIFHEFYPLRHCQRSDKNVIGYSEYNSVKDCAEYARSIHGLAFNFSPPGRFNINLHHQNDSSLKSKQQFYNCEVLDCPEFKNLSSMVNDTRFDYYSLYAYPPREFVFAVKINSSRKFFEAGENATCIPMIGMFTLFLTRSNYSVAYNTCGTIRGNLAHVASEIRNFELAKLVAMSTSIPSSYETLAYVGLKETGRNEFTTSAKESLSCFFYRAWAAGHPPEVRNSGCVGLTANSTWKVFNCNRRHIFICEILTSGPNPQVNNLSRECSVTTPNNRFIPNKTLN